MSQQLCLILTATIAGVAWSVPQALVAEESRSPAPDPTHCPEGAKAAVVYFVLQDCPVSNALVPAMKQIADDYQNEMRFTLVYVDPQLSEEAMCEHRSDYEISIPALVDGKHRWVQKAGATRAPEAAVFLPGGQVFYRGMINDLYASLGKRRATVSKRPLRDALDAVVAGETDPVEAVPAVGCYLSDLEPS